VQSFGQSLPAPHTNGAQLGSPAAPGVTLHTPAALQTSHSPSHADAQHTPSAQKLLTHSSATPQFSPLPKRGVQLPFELQKAPGAHWAAVVQVVVQAPAVQRYAPHGV
jgi:hypothetical protein